MKYKIRILIIKFKIKLGISKENEKTFYFGNAVTEGIKRGLNPK